MDLSSSMQETMGSATGHTSPAGPGRTRMDAVKDAVKTFIRSRRGSHRPRRLLRQSLRRQSADLDHGTCCYVDFIDDKILQGEGRDGDRRRHRAAQTTCSRGRRRHLPRHQVVIVFTDGESNRGREPVDVLKEAKDAGIRGT